MSGYTRHVSGQRLGKQVPIARRQILNTATAGLQQWKRCVFYVVLADIQYYNQGTKLDQFGCERWPAGNGVSPSC
jgi:hypothetical protein